MVDPIYIIEQWVNGHAPWGLGEVDSSAVWPKRYAINLLVTDLSSYFSICQAGWWFGTCCIFLYIGNVIIPTGELIFFRGVGSTTRGYFMTFFGTQFETNLMMCSSRCCHRRNISNAITTARPMFLLTRWKNTRSAPLPYETSVPNLSQ